ncbi:hypothetical protein IMG5_136830 [Ichthyophthirius multifiliis]|uniref:Uncharacterized protein n=1 Tax=Ichthyophthirius multifiliis TaxID=5932 RepID=G0QX03_ICHMU|nr:hypothetical protein IMG5_136830 [Ichthyophthirius multifiliis]EGR30251.1 hypothetical protein IMG5_136830 [Ichthyophthirius multifiliis]|eukprot:XP_004031847.1 hypothetical protein IMG5_136830 [Ichthyophthirius multifiliis]
MEKSLKISLWIINNLLDENYVFIDGINVVNKTCSSQENTKWTYNQGVYINAFISLSQYYKNYSNLFIDIIKNNLSYITIKNNTDNPFQFIPSDLQNYVILLENNWAKYSETHSAFKGIYIRYLSYAYRYFKQISQDQQYAKIIENYIINNANYILPIQKDWSYPYNFQRNNKENDKITAGTTISAFDLYAFNDILIEK